MMLFNIRKIQVIALNSAYFIIMISGTWVASTSQATSQIESSLTFHKQISLSIRLEL